jgi:hypothetical protein
VSGTTEGFLNEGCYWVFLTDYSSPDIAITFRLSGNCACEAVTSLKMTISPYKIVILNERALCATEDPCTSIRFVNPRKEFSHHPKSGLKFIPDLTPKSLRILELKQ